jgi:hypothetical protein
MVLADHYRQVKIADAEHWLGKSRLCWTSLVATFKDVFCPGVKEGFHARQIQVQ